MHLYPFFLISKGDKVAEKRIPRPIKDGEYIRIYCPLADVYKGPDTESFKNGTRYEVWLPNDFSVMRDGNTWHIVGITHPKPKGFCDSFNYTGDIHEAEYQLFHAYAEGESFAQLLKEASFTDGEKILYPSERSGEQYEIWAPQLMKFGGKNSVIYSPGKIRMAQSETFEGFKSRVLFECKSEYARDPYVFEENGVYYVIYTEGKEIKYRTTTDLVSFSDEKTLMNALYPNAETESPCLYKRDGVYYLFLCIWDGRNGAYDERTFVFASDTIDGLKDTAPVTVLDAHAPEIVEDTDGTSYLLSVFYPENGISAVKLKWE